MNHVEQSKELRIGNIHESDCFDIPRMGVSGVRIDNKCFAYISAHGIALVESGHLEFTPSILTENWLKAFGFKKDFIYHYRWNIETFIIHRTFVDFSKDGGQENECWQLALDYGQLLTTKIQYVHQLQNLYFALTEKELELITPPLTKE